MAYPRRKYTRTYGWKYDARKAAMPSNLTVHSHGKHGLAAGNNLIGHIIIGFDLPQPYHEQLYLRPV